MDTITNWPDGFNANLIHFQPVANWETISKEQETFYHGVLGWIELMTLLI